jgi:hypothetical protein
MRSFVTASRRFDIVRISVAVSAVVVALCDGRTITDALAAMTAFPAVPSEIDTFPEKVTTPDAPFGAVETFVTSAAAPTSI